MTNVNDAQPKRALAIAAHPDDTEFGCAGTAALWSRQGWEFYYLICTNGNKGSDDPDMTPEKLAPIRQEEQRAAAEVAGVKDVFFLGYEDGELTYSRQLLGDVVRYIRQLRPYAVFTARPGIDNRPRQLHQSLRSPLRRPGDHRRRVPGRPRPLELPGADRGGPGAAQGEGALHLVVRQGELQRRYHGRARY